MNIDPRIIEQFNQRAPFKLEDARLVVLARVGSHSHNTYVPKDDPNALDDVDFMGVVIPPINYALGVKKWDKENVTFQFEELDCVFYSFRKFLSLIIKSNPNVLGLTWMPKEMYLASDETWDLIVSLRQTFSSLEAYPAFTGYAHDQMKKMTHFDIKTQNEWDDALELIEAAGWTKEQVINKENRAMPNQIAVINAYKAQCKRKGIEIITGPGELALYELSKAPDTIKRIHGQHFQGYMGEKRKNLVRKFGYDTKNAAHLVRLMRMCNEFLQTGNLQVYRTTDAQEIRDIKSGKWTLDQVKAEAERLFIEAKELKENSPLPAVPDEEAIDQLVMRVHMMAYGLHK